MYLEHVYIILLVTTNRHRSTRFQCIPCVHWMHWYNWNNYKSYRIEKLNKPCIIYKAIMERMLMSSPVVVRPLSLEQMLILSVYRLFLETLSFVYIAEFYSAGHVRISAEARGIILIFIVDTLNRFVRATCDYIHIYVYCMYLYILPLAWFSWLPFSWFLVTVFV